jgi:predicted ATPase
VEHLLVGDRARVLATSRERLGVPGETVLPIAPLPVSGAAPPARHLFLDRAAAAGLGPAAYALDADVVDHVVSRLDGLPLAIEMAAARAPLLGLTELADALDRELDDGPTAMRAPYRSTPERHRTLRAVIAWSEALLDPPERAALVTWPVFAGPVDAADAAAVLGAARDVVESLVLRSLLLPFPGPDGTMRYRMLHTVRAAVLASDHGVDDALRRRHAEHFADVAQWCSRALRGPEEPQGVARITGVVAELRSAHVWARSHDRPLAAAISRSLHPYAVNTVDEEVLAWGTRLLTEADGAPGAPGAPRAPDGPAAAAHVALAAQLTVAGELGAAAARARDALALATDDVTRLQALEVLADTAIYDGRLAECRAWGERMVELAGASGDAHYLAMAAGSLSLARAYGGDMVGATTVLAECRTWLAEVTPTPAPTDEGWLRYAEGEIAIDTDTERALRSLEQAIALADCVGNRYLGGVARVSATSLRARHGDPADALDAFADVIRWWLDHGDRTHLVTTLRNVLDLLVRLGADVAAAELCGAVGHDRPSPSFGGERTRLDANRGVLTARLEPAVLRDRMATGATRDVEEAAREVLSAIGGLRT